MKQQTGKSLGISNTEGNIAMAGFLILEVCALYRFHQISKSNDVYGVQEGYFGIQRDHSDGQWGEFSEHLLELVIFQIIFLIGSTIVKQLSTDRKRNLQYYNIALGLSYAFFLHSIGMFFQLTLILLFYLYQKLFFKTKYFIPLLWVLAIFTLFMNEYCDGYSFTAISPSLKFLDNFKKDNQLVRWNVVFNMILLRIISFSIDRVWSSRQLEKFKYDVVGDEIIVKKTYKDLVQEHQNPEEYNFLGYLSYLFYVPLLFSGPSMGYNAFNSQLKIPQQTMTRAQVIKYVLKVYLVDYLGLEILLHFCYPNAIPKLIQNHHIVSKLSALDLHIMGFSNLVFLWFKFLTIWRIARGWALMDGIETPENMNRCIYNNYNFSGFWRSWHRSFNLWLIRYIYVPLGGSKYKILNMWVVFTFVAIWHDFKLDLILWAWTICLALIPEIGIMAYFDKERFYRKSWFKGACRLAAGFQIEMMCLSNIIGFGSGSGSISDSIKQFMTFEGLVCILFYIVVRNGFAATIQFKIRENEKAESNDKNF